MIKFSFTPFKSITGKKNENSDINHEAEIEFRLSDHIFHIKINSKEYFAL